MLQIIVKAVSSVIIVFLATYIAKKYPGIGGLIAVMPLAGLIIFIWTYIENNGAKSTMVGFTSGALFGIVPTIAFYLVALLAFNRGMTLWPTLATSLGVWLICACILIYFLK